MTEKEVLEIIRSGGQRRADHLVRSRPGEVGGTSSLGESAVQDGLNSVKGEHVSGGRRTPRKKEIWM